MPSVLSCYMPAQEELIQLACSAISADKEYTLFFITTSNFGAEAERSYIFLPFEAENVLKMFLNYMVYTICISVNK